MSAKNDNVLALAVHGYNALVTPLSVTGHYH